METVTADIAAATSAGIVTTIVGHPLDTIKVHLQTNPSLKTTLQATRSLFAQGALFRGVVPPICNAIVMNTVMFSTFHGIKDMFTNNNGGSSGAALAAGLVSGFVTACISTPTDLVKIKSQLALHGKGTTLDTLRSTRLSHLFRGHLANLGREGVFTMVYLGLYDLAEPDGFWQIAITSSLTGGLAWVASYPFDTVKTTMQSTTDLRYRGAIQRIGSITALYRGCGASTGRAILVTSLRMIVYEYALKLCS